MSYRRSFSVSSNTLSFCGISLHHKQNSCQYCEIQYENDRFSINKKGGISYLTVKNIQDSISFESFKDAVIITEEEFNKARSREGIKKQEKPIKIYTKEELKSSILKYTSPDGSIYYLEHPEISEEGIENKPGNRT